MLQDGFMQRYNQHYALMSGDKKPTDTQMVGCFVLSCGENKELSRCTIIDVRCPTCNIFIISVL